MRLPLVVLACAAGWAGDVKGTVKLESTGGALHHVTVVIPKLNLVTESGEDGTFRFSRVPAGIYDVLAHASGLSDERKSVVVNTDGAAEVSFALRLMPIRQEVTVTASGKIESTLESLNSVTTLDTLDLAGKAATSLGDLVDGQAGVHKRSFGPGTTRPVLRGFDGDRVLIMQDGVRTGSLSSQSGDHGEPVDPQSLERVEIVRGPATLLYGSNAIGGVVNMITDHHQGQDAPHDGVHGYLSAIGGSNNSLYGGSAGVAAGSGPWVMRINLGGQHMSDYSTARERVDNSGARTMSGGTSLSRYGSRGWFTAGYNTQRGTYQIPETDFSEGRTSLPFFRHNGRVGGGLKNLGSAFDNLNFSLNYSKWRHDETVDGETENEFSNGQFDYRMVVEQKRKGPLSGSFGVWGLHRDYEAVGAEAITPPVSQNSFAVFGVESLQLERAKIQFGGRLENTRYSPEGLPQRNFTGFSGSVGVNLPLWRGGALVGSYSHSYRAPALEELYANGPHVGNLTYEIGDPNLRGEKSNGFDGGLRHVSTKIRAEANWFYYRLNHFVYLAPTGNYEDGLREALYAQSDSRYAGVDGRFQAQLHPALWLNLGFDAVRANLRVDDTPLPRIPPVRGRMGVEWRLKNLSVAPDWTLSAGQDRLFPGETETAGYGTVSVRTSYTLARQHTLHVFSVNWFNANNAYYRNHLSFIKDYAAEIGRGVAVSYNLRFY